MIINFVIRLQVHRAVAKGNQLLSCPTFLPKPIHHSPPKRRFPSAYQTNRKRGWRQSAWKFTDRLSHILRRIASSLWIFGGSAPLMPSHRPKPSLGKPKLSQRGRFSVARISPAVCEDATGPVVRIACQGWQKNTMCYPTRVKQACTAGECYCENVRRLSCKANHDAGSGRGTIKSPLRLTTPFNMLNIFPHPMRLSSFLTLLTS